MVAPCHEDEKSFMKRYHDRSKVKSVYFMMKTFFGNHQSSKKRRIQRQYLKAIGYNVGIVNLHRGKKTVDP